jgi:hypothetical protein
VVGTWIGAKTPLSRIMTREGPRVCGGEDETPPSRISSKGGGNGRRNREKAPLTRVRAREGHGLVVGGCSIITRK